MPQLYIEVTSHKGPFKGGARPRPISDVMGRLSQNSLHCTNETLEKLSKDNHAVVVHIMYVSLLSLLWSHQSLWTDEHLKALSHEATCSEAFFLIRVFT